MTVHPRQSATGDGATRRDFLAKGLGLSLAASGAGALLAACGTTAPSATGSTNDKLAGPAGIQLARVGNDVTLPIYADNKAIASGLKPESGTLNLFNWSDYINPKLTKAFEKKYGVQVTVTNFEDMEQAISKLSTGSVDFDVFFPTVDYLDRLVAGKLLQPLNYSYVPNLHANVWPSLVNPFYDRGPHYTVPYVVYTTGIAWRTDQVKKSPAQYRNPYDILWDASFAKGRVGIIDDMRQALGLALLRRGVTDLNTADPKLISRAQQDLEALSRATNVRVNQTDYTDIPSGKEWIAQAFSGDMVSAQYYLPKGTPPSVIGYWYPQGGGSVGSDTMAVLNGSQKPVLAHLFINFMLDPSNAVTNMGYVGYQPPQNGLTASKLIADGLVPKSLRSAVVTPEQIDHGYRVLTLTPEASTLWENAWSQFMAGV
jgi:spermidine/putrescine transport system substrate-binding protein